MTRNGSIKYVSAAEALSHIPRGARIFIGSGAAVPVSLVQEMGRAPEKFIDCQTVSLLTLGDAPYTNPAFSGSFRHNALFIGANVRRAVEQGFADYTPIFLSEIPQMFRSRQMPIGAALIQVAPPHDGWCNLGIAVDVIKAAAQSADLVIAEVNPRMPRLPGDSEISVELIDHFVHCEHELLELAPRETTDEAERIGRFIKDLVRDGDTIQMGIGQIPDAVLPLLADKHDLGIHTEMLSDGFVELSVQGVITNARKKIHPGKSVASFLLGTRRLYDYVREHPHLVEMHPNDHVNDPFVIGQIDNMVAINTAIQVDLTGQVCSDSIGDRFYSGIGGQVDFIRGAARSKGGRPIIALPSTAEKGTVSRIVPRLDGGAGVVTTRGDVHYVVTEYGVAYLHGKTVRERALALIEIAHPKFRPWLLAEAKRRKYVYLDQIEPLVKTPTYPAALEVCVRDKIGQRLLLRPVRGSDEGRLHDLYYSMSDESLFKRFFQVRQTLAHSTLQKLCNVDYEKEMSIVAVIGEPWAEMIVGAASYSMDSAGKTAEVAFVVEDAYQGHGIGRALVQRIIEIARRKGIETLSAQVLTSNGAMTHLLESAGGRPVGPARDGISTFRLSLTEPGPTSPPEAPPCAVTRKTS